MRHLATTVPAILVLWASTPAVPAVSAQTNDGDRAVQVADRMLSALGGLDTFHKTRYIRFTFIRGESDPILLVWDKWTGRYRLETTLEGKPWLVLMNLNSGEGRSWVDGTLSAGQAREQQLQRARQIWAGEIYWFLAPYKVKDPGVILRYGGSETLEGTAYDVLHLSFEPASEPGDQFWMYVNRETGLMDRWRFRLRRGAEGEFWWRNWRAYGPLMLAQTREAVDGSVTIRMEDIQVADTMADEVFESPDPISGT